MTAILLGLAPVGIVGQKAEPRAAFLRGSTVSTLRGTLRGRQEQEYVFSAIRGQILNFQIKSEPAKSADLKIYGDNGIVIPRSAHGLGFQTVLPQTGDFEIVITRLRRATGRSRFVLSIELR